MSNYSQYAVKAQDKAIQNLPTEPYKSCYSNKTVAPLSEDNKNRLLELSKEGAVVKMFPEETPANILVTLSVKKQDSEHARVFDYKLSAINFCCHFQLPSRECDNIGNKLDRLLEDIRGYKNSNTIPSRRVSGVRYVNVEYNIEY